MEQAQTLSICAGIAEFWPQPLPYLDSPADRASGAIDVTLEVWLQTDGMRAQGAVGDCIVRTGFAQAAYWTMAQLVAHHTVNGCNLMPGDLLGTGTLSGEGPGQAAVCSRSRRAASARCACRMERSACSCTTGTP